MLSFVAIKVDSEAGSFDEVAEAIAQKPNVEELYAVTGEADILALVRTVDITEFRDFAKEVLRLKGVRSTVTSITVDVLKGPRSKT